MNDSDYDEIARRFFNQFLELKVAINSGTTQPPKNYAKELAQYEKANAALKAAAADLAKRNAALEDDAEQLEAACSDLRRQVNELTINLGLAQEKLQGLGALRRSTEEDKARAGHSFRELMSDESRRAWDQLMKEIPYRGTKDTGDE